MSTCEFVDFQTLEEDVVYTVKTMQYLFGSAGYFYLITVDTPGKSTHYMTIHEGPWEKPIHDKLESLRKLGSNKKFTFYIYILRYMAVLKRSGRERRYRS